MSAAAMPAHTASISTTRRRVASASLTRPFDGRGILEKAAAAAKKKKAPTIYCATRTHSQITQVVWELRKTPY
ncbi:hypothetical protein ZWY2020_006250 [Hordeum vulgare]|nr:hypothetical protein ZWY2020_006250 [Hordeum vulgare]